MFRFVLQVAFLGRLFQSRLVRLALVFIFLGATVAGLLYAVIVFSAVRSTSEKHHVQHYSSR